MEYIANEKAIPPAVTEEGGSWAEKWLGIKEIFDDQREEVEEIIKRMKESEEYTIHDKRIDVRNDVVGMIKKEQGRAVPMKHWGTTVVIMANPNDYKCLERKP